MQRRLDRLGLQRPWPRLPWCGRLVVGSAAALRSAIQEVDVLLQTLEGHSAPEAIALSANPTASGASTDTPRTILVGVDGSDEARAAFTAALERAGPDDTVAAVHAYEPVPLW